VEKDLRFRKIGEGGEEAGNFSLTQGKESQDETKATSGLGLLGKGGGKNRRAKGQHAGWPPTSVKQQMGGRNQGRKKEGSRKYGPQVRSK